MGKSGRVEAVIGSNNKRPSAGELAQSKRLVVIVKRKGVTFCKFHPDEELVVLVTF